MVTLKKHQYDAVRPMFAGIPQASWHLASMENKNLGAVIVDNFETPVSAYLETPYLFYYFAGEYDKRFMTEIIDHIVSDLIPAGETRPLFIFSSNQDWKDGLENYLRPYINPDFGAYLVRRLHHLNVDKYKQIRENITTPDGYAFELSENGATAFVNGEKVCACGDGGLGLGYMDFDVFTHPEHRNKGLALVCCSRLIDHCLDNGLTPQWGCWTINVPSCRLAEKLGFDVTAETTVNFAEVKRPSFTAN